jgi:excisionase family DNA binding protein
MNLPFNGGTGMSPRDRLASVLSPELVSALEELVAERVATELARVDTSGRAWLTVEQAAERLGCSRDAVRMRAKRGRLEKRNHGRRVYVSAASVATLT